MRPFIITSRITLRVSFPASSQGMWKNFRGVFPGLFSITSSGLVSICKNPSDLIEEESVQLSCGHPIHFPAEVIPANLLIRPDIPCQPTMNTLQLLEVKRAQEGPIESLGFKEMCCEAHSPMRDAFYQGANPGGHRNKDKGIICLPPSLRSKDKRIGTKFASSSPSLLAGASMPSGLQAWWSRLLGFLS